MGVPRSAPGGGGGTALTKGGNEALIKRLIAVTSGDEADRAEVRSALRGPQWEQLRAGRAQLLQPIRARGL